MIKIKHKELALLLGVSVRYSQQLIYRRGWRLNNAHFKEIMDLVYEYRRRNEGRKKG